MNKEKFYCYVFSDCCISKTGVMRNIISAKENHYLNYNNNNSNIQECISLITDYPDLFYPSIIATILSLSIDILKKCNYKQLPIIWLSGRTGCGKSTLVRDTFFLPEKQDGTQNFNGSIQSTKLFYQNVASFLDCIIVYDDIRKTKSNASNQKISTILEQIVRQSSESPDEMKNIFVITGELEALSSQGLSFKNRCMEFAIENIIQQYSRILNLINEKNLMKVFWIKLITYIAENKKELTKKIVQQQKDWEQTYISDFDPRVIRIGFAEHMAIEIFKSFINKTHLLKKWNTYATQSVIDRMKKMQILYFGQVTSFISIFKELLETHSVLITAANTNPRGYSLSNSSFILEYFDPTEKQPNIGIFFGHGVLNELDIINADHPFLILNIDAILYLLNKHLKKQFPNDDGHMIFFEKVYFQRELQKNGLIYVDKRTSDTYNYALQFNSVVKNYHDNNFCNDNGSCYVDNDDLEKVLCWIIKLDNCEELIPLINHNTMVRGWWYKSNSKSFLSENLSRLKPFLTDTINY